MLATTISNEKSYTTKQVISKGKFTLDDAVNEVEKSNTETKEESDGLKDGLEAPKGFTLILIIFSLCLTQFLPALDTTIVSTALSSITRDLHATAAEYTWVSASYTLASTACTPLWARCSDIVGRKLLLVVAKLCFMGGSVLAALSKSPIMMIAGRTIQGLGAGGMQIFIQLIIADIFPLKLRAKYYGLHQPAICRTIPFTSNLYHKTQYEKAKISNAFKTFDWGGSILIVGGTILLLCGLEGGASLTYSWTSGYTLGLLLSGVVALTIFIPYEWNIPSLPLIPLAVFQGRSKLAILSASFAHTFAFIAYDFFLPLYFQAVLGASPLHSALYLLILIVTMSAVASGTGIFIKCTGRFREPMWFGSMVMTLGTGLFINFGSTTEWPKLIVYQLLAALGAGTMFISPMIAMQHHLHPTEISAGISAYTFLRSLGSAVSVVCGGVVLQSTIHTNTLSTWAVDNVGHLPTHPDIDRYASGFSKLWIFYSGFCGLMLISTILIGKTSAKNQADEEAEGSSTQS
ncbi:uncharacterized protein PV09_08626 [Verruconis gallopava]|uniref:Major facilitator superfamily (MFS) profile domain-containing protein n=1 Tax=Verruconis gallopava TaxID=253628 RepID=A0A0D2AKX5_9PEZI|nr:uncharacterized protein PV09_08626 [Verruconis gallopava]KIV99693.1 hypothetical protein PV09_08626 [Verruconis gallopava]